MATKLYLHNAANTLSGTFPTGEQSSVAANWSVTGANTLRTMNKTKGTAQASLAGSSAATTAQQYGFCGFFCSDPLDSIQAIDASQTVTLNIALKQSDTNMVFGRDNHCNIYVWRPSTGIKIGTIGDNATTAGDAEPSAANSEQVDNCTITSGGLIAALAGDVIICEIWEMHTQSAATAYTGTVYFDGTTENATTRTVVSNHASYINLGTSTLTFSSTPTSISGAFSNTLATVGLTTAGGVLTHGSQANTLTTVTRTGTGTNATHGAKSATLATVTATETGDVTVSGAKSATLAAATLSGAGTVAAAGTAIGTFNQALGAVTRSGVGVVVTHGAFNRALATVALSGIGTNASHCALSSTLAPATLSAAGLNSTPLTLVVRTIDAGGGSGASRTRTRRKFIVPTEPGFEWSQDKIFGRDEPTPTVPEQIPPTPVRKLSMAEVMTEARPTSGPAQLPMPGRVIELEQADEYSDEDMMMLLLLAI